MATYTTNYNLYQWAAEDPFLRTDFNGDFLKIDTALGELAAESALIPDLSYNVYNLLLQNEYDGKTTGQKRGLLFDGFRTLEGVAQRSSALLHDGKSALVLHRSGQSDVGWGYSGNEEKTAGRSHTAVGGGLWTGLTYRIYNNVQYASTTEVHYTVQVDGKTVLTGTQRSPSAPVGSYCEDTLTFSQALPVCAGTVCAVTLETNGSFFTPGLDSAGTALGGAFHFTPVTGASASLTSVTYALPACGGLRAWVRHTGGTAALAVKQGSLQHSLTPAAQRQTVNLQGAACTESEFTLSQTLTAGDYAVVLTLSLGESDTSAVYDYGVLLR